MQTANSFKLQKNNNKRKEENLKRNIFMLWQSAFSCQP